MIYLEKIKLLTEEQEISISMGLYGMDSAYPCKIFPYKQLSEIDFSHITILYGGNGSGKTTLLNIIVQKLKISRKTIFNTSNLFEAYLNDCVYKMAKNEYWQNYKIPLNSKLIASDDIFNHIMEIRKNNEKIDSKRQQQSNEYYQIKNSPSPYKTMEDYEQLKKFVEANSKTHRSFIRDRAGDNIKQFSNGESAMMYFDKEIEEDSLYLLDEPENSLSPKFQLQLINLISDNARLLGCQFVIATHSPFILSIPNAKIYNLDSTPVTINKWQELENVKIYYDFFNSHRKDFE